LPPGTTDAADTQWGAVPALGQHTDSILASLGYSRQRIADLRAAGAL
jgi:itaconate CoA-transferase